MHMRDQNSFWISVIGIIVVFLIGYGAFAYIKRSHTASSTAQMVCTMDTMQCPNGSFVGRTGPDCQFVCPITASGSNTTSATGSTVRSPTVVEVALNQTVQSQGISITPTRVTQDSRCPTDVQCIQAGTVDVETRIESALGDSTQIMKVGAPLTTESDIITLIKVAPDKNSKTTIQSSDYRFTFQIAKR